MFYVPVIVTWQEDTAQWGVCLKQGNALIGMSILISYCLQENICQWILQISLHLWHYFPLNFLVIYHWQSVYYRESDIQLNNHIRQFFFSPPSSGTYWNQSPCVWGFCQGHPYLRSFHKGRRRREAIRKVTMPAIKIKFGKRLFSWHKSKAKQNEGRKLSR